MPDLYCVFGNPIGHSKSPLIHTRFAASSAQNLRYEARQAPLDGFAAAMQGFIREGGRGANVTVPFKEEAFRLATRLTTRAERAGAVNTLLFDDTGILGDNTDGAGLLADITQNQHVTITGKRVLLLGAGGASRGVLAPLLAAGPAQLTLANRTADKAHALAAQFGDLGPVCASTFEALAGQCFDLVINATSASLAGEALPLPAGLFSAASLAYDMMYGQDTPFLALARRQGATHLSDGLGMLVEQAAEAFLLWRGLRPATAPVLAMLRTA